MFNTYLKQAESKMFRLWHSLMNHFILLGSIGLVYLTLIYLAKLSIPCGDENWCVGTDFPAGIRVGDLVSTASVYVTVLMSGVLGRLAIFLYCLNGRISNTTLSKPTKVRRQITPIRITSVISVALYASLLWVAWNGTIPECSPDNSEISDSTALCRYNEPLPVEYWILVAVRLSIVVYYAAPLAIGVAFASSLISIVWLSRKIMRDCTA